MYLVMQYTWEHLPYMEVWKSGHETANLGGLSHTFFHGLKLLDLSSFMATSSNCWPWRFHGRFWEAWHLLSPNRWPWRFHGRFWEFSPIHENWNVLKLPTSAVLWPLFSPVTGNCKTSAVLWPLLGGVTPTVTKPLTLAVLWPLLGYDKKWPWNC